MDLVPLMDTPVLPLTKFNQQLGKGTQQVVKVSRAGKRVTDIPVPRVTVPQNHNSHDSQTRDIVQSPASPILFKTLVGPASLLWWYLFSWCTHSSLTPIIFPPPSSEAFPYLWGKGHKGYQLDVFSNLMSGYGSPLLLPSAAGRSFSDDEWVRHIKHSTISLVIISLIPSHTFLASWFHSILSLWPIQSLVLALLCLVCSVCSLCFWKAVLFWREMAGDCIWGQKGLG